MLLQSQIVKAEYRIWPGGGGKLSWCVDLFWKNLPEKSMLKPMNKDVNDLKV